MFFYPRTLGSGSTRISKKHNDIYGYSNDPKFQQMNNFYPPYNQYPMEPDQRRMNGMPMQPDQRRMNGMPMEPDQRRMNGMPMEPDQRRMNGMPMEPDQRRMNGMPMEPDQRRMNGMPMEPDQRRMNGMPDENNQVNQATLREALLIMEEALKNENVNDLFYEDLIELAPDDRQKEIITSIRENERKHNLYYRDVYKEMTGEEITPVMEENYKKPTSYIEGLERALFKELNMAEKNRVIYNVMPNRYFRDILFEIITDELKNANQYNYLYTTNF